MLSEPEMIAAYEAALAAADLDAAPRAESPDWWRFARHGVSFQGGVHSRDVRVLATVCRVETDADMDALSADIAAADAPPLVRFREMDCYIYAAAHIPFAAVTQAQIEQAIRECFDAVKSPAGERLRSRWRDWS